MPLGHQKYFPWNRMQAEWLWARTIMMHMPSMCSAFFPSPAVEFVLAIIA